MDGDVDYCKLCVNYTYDVCHFKDNVASHESPLH